MIDLDEPKHTISQMGEATGVSVNTIRQWYKRGVLTLGATDAAAGGEGLARYFSSETALVIGIMGEILSLHLASPASAEKAARRFVHTGDESRLPSHLYPEGGTVLVLYPEGDEIGSRIVNTTDETKLRDVMKKSAAAIIDLEVVVQRVRIKLGLGRDPRVTPNKRRR